MKRTRGPNKGKPWARPEGEGVVLRLPVDVRDPVQRALLEGVFSASFSMKRALQSDARHRVMAYRAAKHERKEHGSEVVRERLGLSQQALERAAKEHLDAAPHLRRFATKALVLHIADSVWSSLERHLFPDKRGRRQGLLHIGRRFDFFRIPGRARSHREPRKWETFRLHGTLAGHRAEYTDSGGRFFQPRSIRPVPKPDGSWWRHHGALVIVFSGLGAGELALPVRLPAAPSNQPALDHYLADPKKWHKVDLVRSRDPNTPGGWRYEAHLMVLAPPYVSAATAARRERAARETVGRSVGIDVNVSNVTVASHADSADLQITRVARDAGERERAEKRAKKERRRSRKLDRSRRAANREQYEPSAKQAAQADLRTRAGRPPRVVIPKGPRKSYANGRPLKAYRTDFLSAIYRRERAAQVEAAAAAARARKDAAKRLAGALTLKHGFRIAIEDCDLSTWARRWGRSLHLFSPGTLVAALESEVAAVARLAGLPGGVTRASTATALSQHCLCGARVAKSLGERIHRCSSCGIVADRDAMSAALASVVAFGDPTLPSTAFIDLERGRSLLSEESRSVFAANLEAVSGRQDARSESTVQSALDGSSVAETERTSRVVDVVARRSAGTAPSATPDEIGNHCRTKSERARTRTSLSHDGEKNSPPLRDSS